MGTPKHDVVALQGPAFASESEKPLDEPRNDFSRIENAADVSAVFAEKLPDNVSRLRRAYEKVSERPHDSIVRGQLYRSAIELKANSASFGYDLIALLCGDLCEMVEASEALTPRQVIVAGCFVAAIERVAQFNITGSGGRRAHELVDQLRTMAANDPSAT